MIYLDDAGLSNPRHEPFVIVAGVLIDADRQWLEVEQYLKHLADLHAPPKKRDQFFFHATELFSGGGFFPREEWPKEERWKILDKLIQIPRKFKLPITYGSVEKANIRARYPTLSAGELIVHCHTIAFTIAAFAADFYLRTGNAVKPGEVASIVIENNEQARKNIRGMYNFVKDPRNVDLFPTKNFGKISLSRIIGNPHFEEKAGASLLQIADACAFTIKRHFMAKPDSDRFYLPLVPGLVIVEKPKPIASGS